jgi:hypothetical protein
MNVDIDVGDAFDPLLEQPRDGQSRIVVDAEAAGPVRHGVVETAGGVEGVLGSTRMDGLSRHQRGPRHPGPRLVHLGEDRVVAGPVAEPVPRPFFPVPGPFRRVDVLGRVDQRDLLVGGVSGWRFSNPFAVDQAEVVYELSGEDDPGRPERMLGAVVVPGPAVAVPDQFDTLAHVLAPAGLG